MAAGVEEAGAGHQPRLGLVRQTAGEEEGEGGRSQEGKGMTPGANQQLHKTTNQGRKERAKSMQEVIVPNIGDIRKKPFDRL